MMLSQTAKSGIVRCGAVLVLVGAWAVSSPSALAGGKSCDDGYSSVARHWDELMLDAIRRDLARPTIHARNLYHVHAAMWDAWAAYDPDATAAISQQSVLVFGSELEEARHEAISYAAYRVLRARFANSPGAATSLAEFADLMDCYGYDRKNFNTAGSSPAAVGNRIAIEVLAFGLNDNSNEANNYANEYYEPVNEPLIVVLPGNPGLIDPNRWQPLALTFFVDQGGNPIPGGYPPALSPEWGQVSPFALSQDDVTIYQRDGYDWWVYHDPGAMPMIGTPTEDDYKWGHEQVAMWQGLLDPTDGVMIDISPASLGNAVIPNLGDFAAYQMFYDRESGGDNGEGYAINPSTGSPYTPQLVPRGDYGRVLAEFWADGPSSETPPGHWFTILNAVSDHPDLEKRIGGVGPIVDDLEWDVKSYVALGGGMIDAAITAWAIKGWYDSSRPITAIRYMCDQGQCSNPKAANFDPDGIHLVPDFIELVTAETTAAGQKHEHLAGEEGKIALNTWRGPDYINNPDTDVAGVGWILAENWWPYQRPTFVSPPFPGYISGHSTYSRTAAELLTALTGDPYFPGGMGEFHCPQNEYLVFEDGPSMDITLQWAKYNDASDQCSLSRIYGGIHPGFDDIPGRHLGQLIAADAWAKAVEMYGVNICVGDLVPLPSGDDQVTVSDIIAVISAFGLPCNDCLEDLAPPGGDGQITVSDILAVLIAFGPCP